ncbi:hypothetical protein [Xenorhabdus bovienii]|uniref:Uncharacterized protein n=1 Tax=Xenorhabdus bovienii str. feltiae Moldova TaxID=1398200 RepID=A0A077NTA8_XENBV|nr:hypothetical protein [Xenorhabdus bovienii]CDH00806.1 hypothetical protein XBFM1_190009 [Xenorhabdus bovienii str. feltiae Moldova]
MNTQDNKPETPAAKEDEFSDAAITGKGAAMRNNANNIFGFGNKHTNFLNSHFGA